MAKINLGRVQLRIMQVLWQRGQANAREITEALNEGDPVAHSTVQTLLRQLEDKGTVRHESRERTFVFFPVVQEESVTRNATRELIGRVFGGDAAGLVAYLLKEEKISRKELQALKKLIDEKTSERGD